jgi:hypothetical protein
MVKIEKIPSRRTIERSVTIIPGIPAVTETHVVTVVPAQPPKVNITFTVEEAALLRNVIGHLCTAATNPAERIVNSIYKKFASVFRIVATPNPFESDKPIRGSLSLMENIEKIAKTLSE